MQNSIQYKDQTSTISLYPILAVNFVGTLGYSIILPFLVFLVTRLGGNALIYGLLSATYSMFQLIGAPILGKWSDTYGRRKVLFLSQLGTLVSWVIFLFALFIPIRSLFDIDSPIFGKFVLTLPLVVLFFARALDGVTGGNVSVANAYLADVTEEKKRNENFGKMAISSNLGFIFGPALAGLFGATGWGEILPVLAALFISVLATLIIAFKLPESKPCLLKRSPERVNVRKILGQEHKDCYELKAAEKIAVKACFKIKHLPYIMILYFLTFFGFNLFYTAFPVHAVKSLSWSIKDTGTFFAVLSLMMVIVQGPILKRATKKYSDGVLIIAGSLILGTNFLLLISRGTLMIYAAAALFAIGNGIMWPSVLSILSKVAGQQYQGAIQGYASSIGSVASIIGLIIGGIIYEVLEAWVFAVSAILIYSVFLMSFRMLSIEKSVQEIQTE
jgi:MFS family permease